MRRWGLPFGILAIALGAAFYYQQEHAGGRAGFPAPDFTMNDLDGQSYHLADLHGKIVFLNLWATWCAPCRAEMPSLEALYRRFQDQDLVMLAVSEDDSLPPVRGFAQQFGLTFPVLFDSGSKLPSRYGVTGFPETFIIDRDGRVIQHIVGPEDWDSPRAFTYFTQLLTRSAAGTQRTAGDATRAGS